MRQDGRPQVGRLLLAGSLKSQRTHGGWETAQDFSICLVLSDKNAVRIKDEEVLFRDQFEDLDQMLAEEGGLGPANLEPREPPPLRNADEAAHHIHGAQKGSGCFRAGGHNDQQKARRRLQPAQPAVAMPP